MGTGDLTVKSKAMYAMPAGGFAGVSKSVTEKRECH